MDYGGVCFFIIIITFLYPTFYGKLLFENKTFYGKLTLGIIKWLKKKGDVLKTLQNSSWISWTPVDIFYMISW